jgi:hypothetical protein
MLKNALLLPQSNVYLCALWAAKEACVCSLRSHRCVWPLMQTCPRPFALSRQRVCVLFAQPQMCMAAYADMSTPLCFVKAACVCSLRSHRCAWPLMQTCPRPFALSRQRVCALCVASNGVSGAEKGTRLFAFSFPIVYE